MELIQRESSGLFREFRQTHRRHSNLNNSQDIAGPSERWFALNDQEALLCTMALPREIAEKGNAIYKAKYKRTYEKRYFGQYVAIDVETNAAFVASSAAAAISNAQITGKDSALFHLVRIGYRTGANPT